METKEFTLGADKGLVIDRQMLEAARIEGKVRIIVQDGEIRILPESGAVDPFRLVEELAGALGKDSVGEYDFDLEIDGSHETR